MRFLKILSKDVVLFSCLFPDLICSWTLHKAFRRSPRKLWIGDAQGPGLPEALIPPEKSRSCHLPLWSQLHFESAWIRVA